MDVLSHPNAASVPSGAAAAYRAVSSWWTRLRAERFVVAFIVSFLVELSRGGMTLASWTSAVLFGWPGIAGAVAGQLAAGWIVRGSFSVALVLALAMALPGLCSWIAFQKVGKVGRGLPNFHSYIWVVLSAVLGTLLSAVASSPLLEGGITPALWHRADVNLTGILFLGVPFLLLADSKLRPWMTPIQGELPARHHRRLVQEVPAWVEAMGEETVVLSVHTEPEIRRGMLVGGGMVLALTVVAVPLASVLPVGGSWLLLLYLFPILWAAFEHGQRGAVLAAAASGMAYLLGTIWMATLVQPVHDLWASPADFLILSFAGAFVGRTREKELRLGQELSDSNRLLRRDLLRVAQALTQAVEAKDAYTEGHLRRVSEYAVAVGAKLGLRGQDLEMLHYASMLHDIGKIGIPEEVLGKRGPLDEREAEIMRRHPEIGARLLQKLDLLRGAAPIVLAHQERYDGAADATYPGYPQGLRGDRIPLGARIIAVVDAFDAMTTNRPYRAALSVDSAITEICIEKGRQFDPWVVDVFLEVLDERPWICDAA
jgi:hypothetical protein